MPKRTQGMVLGYVQLAKYHGTKHLKGNEWNSHPYIL